MGTHPIFESDFDCLTESDRMSVHNLCKLNYPLYCCAPFEAKSIFVGGGGGDMGPRTGVPNVVELLELEQNRSEVIAKPTMTVSLEKQCAWNMDAHRGRSLVAFGYSGECHVYHVKRQMAKTTKPAPKQNGNRKGSSKAESSSSSSGMYQRQAIIQTDSKNFQKGVKFSPDGLKLACAGSDGSISVWEISNPREPLWRVTPYTQEIQCIDWSPDGAWIATAARDGRAYLHEADSGKIATELHTLLLVSTGDDRYRFRSLKFIPGESPDSFGIVSAHEPRRQTKPPLPNVVYGWKVTKEDQNYRLARPVVRYETTDRISSMAVSECGTYIGLGCHNGDVHIVQRGNLSLVTKKIAVHGQTVTACCFLPAHPERTPSMFSVSYDNSVRLIPVVPDSTLTTTHIVLIVLLLICAILCFL